MKTTVEFTNLPLELIERSIVDDAERRSATQAGDEAFSWTALKSEEFLPVDAEVAPLLSALAGAFESQPERSRDVDEAEAGESPKCLKLRRKTETIEHRDPRAGTFELRSDHSGENILPKGATERLGEVNLVILRVRDVKSPEDVREDGRKLPHLRPSTAKESRDSPFAASVLAHEANNDRMTLPPPLYGTHTQIL